MKLEKTNTMCVITKKVVDDFNNLTEREFFYKYSGTKTKYLKRVIKYGDPYMNAPLARLGRFLNKLFF